MLKQNESPMQSMELADSSAESSIVENRLSPVPRSKPTVEHDGSIWSHLWFGLGALVLVAPMLIPGIPMAWLAILYGGLVVGAFVAYMLWSGFSSLKARWSRR